MRTRYQTDWPRAYPYSVRFSKPGFADINPETTPLTGHTYWHRLEDEGPGLRRYGLARNLYKTVKHTKVATYPVLSFTGIDTTSGYTAHTSGIFRFPSNPWGLITNGLMPSPTQSEMDACATRAYKQWSTEIPENVSIANFLWELREIKSLVPRLLKFRRDFYHSEILKTPSLLRAWANSRQNLEVFSGNYLAYQFGWKPLLSDIKKFCTLLPSVIQRLEHLKRTYRKWSRINFIANDFAPRAIPPPPSGSGNGQADETVYAMSSYVANYRASALIWHDLQGLDGQLGVLRAFAVALGLNRPGMILWNAIPFSFLVDWIVDVGQYVDNATTADVFGGSLRVLPRGFSVKEKARFSCWYRYYGVWHYQGHQTIERYLRSPGLPVPVSELISPGLTGDQQLLGAALMHQATSGHFKR